jgi:hypothetical protein
VQFVKRERLRVEHEKNLLEIQLRQAEEAEGRRRAEDRDRDEQAREMHRQLEIQKDQNYVL